MMSGVAYQNLYFTIMLLTALGTALFAVSGNIEDRSSRNSLNAIGIFFLVVLCLFMGLRPLSEAFGDMGAYAIGYLKLQKGMPPIFTKDKVFNWFLYFCSRIMPVNLFFLLVDILYIVPCYLFARKYSGSFWFFTFFLFVASFSFWSYGTNGIRNGLATATFLMALVFYDKKILAYAFLALSFGMHNAMIIPIAAFFVAGLYKNPKVYLYIWLAAIPMSLLAGGFFQGLLGGLVSDSRATSYLGQKAIGDDGTGSTGFRWDFLLYSGAAVFAGYWYIVKKQINDKFYIHLYGIYMIANTFWVLVIRANFTNRFAYLSWFLMAAVIAYPALKYKLWNQQYRAVGIIILLYYGFTYFMFLKS